MTSHRLLLKIAVYILLIFNTQLICASMNNEDVITKIFETHGKRTVVNFISQKRDGEITIQKKKSFLNIKGKPDLSLITAKSILQDLKILKMDVSVLEIELDIYIEDESKKQKEIDDKLDKLNSTDDGILLSKKLEYQIQVIQAKYNKSESHSERRKLGKELSILRSAHKQAKNNEKSKLRVYYPDKKSKKTKNVSYCKNIRDKLAKLTESTYRHQIFFCNDRSYRAQNPKSCGKNRYGRQYTLQQYKDEISKLRLQASKNCGS